MKPIPKTVLIFCALCTLPILYAGNALAGETSRASIASSGIQANLASYAPLNQAISADGRYVVFESDASNLFAGDVGPITVTNDIFVHDRQTRKTTLVSRDSNGRAGNSSSDHASISADGRFVAFASFADNLVVADSNNFKDVFVHDRQTGQTTRVSVNLFGVQGNWDSDYPSISADGRFVAFQSRASNLIGFDANGVTDIFVHDRQTHQTTRVSVTSTGAEANEDHSFLPVISASGRFVVFSSNDDGLIDGDNNRATDVFVHDRQTHQTTLVSLSSDGKQGDYSSFVASISADGRYVAFHSEAGTLVNGDNNNKDDIFVHDRQTHRTTRVSVGPGGIEGNNHSFSPSVSADGRYVAFESAASNLVAGDANNAADIFVHDRRTGQTKLFSTNAQNMQGNLSSNDVSINADGRYLVFDSRANNLVAGDTNNAGDVLVHDRFLDKTKTADMQITVTQKPATLARNARGSFTYKVTNNGPNAIDGISLTHLTSAGTVISFTPSQGSCKRYTSIALCPLGTLAAGQSITVQMTVQALSKPSLGQQMSVSAVGVDAKPSNNAIRVVTPVN